MLRYDIQSLCTTSGQETELVYLYLKPQNPTGLWTYIRPRRPRVRGTAIEFCTIIKLTLSPSVGSILSVSVVCCQYGKFPSSLTSA